ncbi:integrase catalytic domain-containing protein [Nephila pilipes]|uniref:Integrase catalytic domain-containing protein n=1 Tax=Nephila pilipes TaxID=299642 RepID=A0A8X6PJK2_NEPPI|nr:integrase catalytic domain-containing protein [Nephila pilipes]
MQHHQRLREQFRKRFRDEYLGLLVPLKSKFVKTIEINDIFLVGYGTLKRSDWLIGRVIDIYPGKDNQIRVVKVKAKTRELTRPVKKLYPLELSSLTETLLKYLCFLNSTLNLICLLNIFEICITD